MFLDHKVIDVHGHISTPPQFRAFAYNLIVLRNPNDSFKMTDESLKPALERHLTMLDERGIDLQLISPRPVAMMHWEREFIVNIWTRTTNDAIAQQCRLHPDRLAGIAQLPQTPEGNIQKCVDELTHCVQELGFVGATLNPDPGGDRAAPGIDQPHWFPIYEKAQDLNTTLIIHPSVTKDVRLDGVPNAYQYNNLTEETLATLLLERGTVFKLFPKLRIVVSHCGGAPRRLLERGALLDATNPSTGSDNMILDSGAQSGGQVGMATVRKKTVVQPDLENLFFDTCAYDPYVLECALRQRGANRMVFGTEVPGSGSHLLNPMTGKPADDVLALIDAMPFLSSEQKLDIVHHNPLRVFPLLKQLS
jgi:predicted TIM-barrel fold metal-dependent hydrolase